MRHGGRRAVAAVVAAVALWAGSDGAAAAVQRYAVAATGGRGAPVTWACEPHDVLVEGAPSAQHLALVRRGLAQLSRATGATWRYAGETSIDADAPRYGGSPIVIRFADVTGYAGMTTLWRERDRWTGGLVTLNLDVPYVPAPDTPEDWGRLHTLVLHELGHLAGLGHVSDPRLVMSDWGSTVHRRYETGDLEGLASLGCSR